jgi:hypothetical protein
MTEFLERLPLRLGALGGLLVGGASLIAGVDPWVSLLRVGLAFVVFGGLGLGLRALMGKPPPPPDPGPTPPPSGDTETGSHVDHKTPEMTVDDL